MGHTILAMPPHSLMAITHTLSAQPSLPPTSTSPLQLPPTASPSSTSVRLKLSPRLALMPMLTMAVTSEATAMEDTDTEPVTATPDTHTDTEDTATHIPMAATTTKLF